MLWIILWIVLFLFLVLIHELGHFFAAKKTGVQVLEFGMWIPPKVCTLWTDASGTEYTLNAIPLGGFVRLKGEDPLDPGTFRAKDSFVMASFVSKTIILLAWVTVNFLFAWGVLTMLFWRGVSPLMIVPENSSTLEIKSYLTPTISFLQEKDMIKGLHVQPVRVGLVLTGGLWQQLGLQSWDRIQSVNNYPVDSLSFKSILKKNIGKEIILNVLRPQDSADMQEPAWLAVGLKGICPDDNCVLGVILNDVKTEQLNIHYQFGLFQSARISLSELGYQAKMTLYRLGKFGASLFSFSGKNIKSEVKNFSGPVGAVKFGEVLVQHGMRAQFLAFGAMISFALAVFNLLPIPALDGGRWLGVIIQTIFFKKKVEKYFTIENYINIVFFVLLMALGVYIILKDLVVAWGVNIPFIS